MKPQKCAHTSPLNMCDITACEFAKPVAVYVACSNVIGVFSFGS